MSRSFTVPKSSRRWLSLEILLLGAIAIAVLLRIIYLGSREFWYDEVLSLILASGHGVDYQAPGAQPVNLRDYSALLIPRSGDVVGTIKDVYKGILGDVHPPLSYFSLYFWLQLFGNSEAALRSLGALLSVGAIGGAYGLGRFVMGHRGGLIFAALLGTNPFYLFHSLNARMYGPLILWTIFSTWAMLHLVEAKGATESVRASDGEIEPDAMRSPHHPSNRSSILWSAILIVSIAAGLLTQYLFVYWVMTLGIFVLIFDRRRWWQQGLRLGAGVLLWMPWFLLGTRKQGRLGEVGNQFSKGNHFADVTQTLSSHLLLGDWVGNVVKTPAEATLAIVAGCLIILLLAGCTFSLWRQGKRRTLFMALSLGILPLCIAFAVDILTGKYTIGFGGGRALIFVLPGCLLLIALWLERAAGRWRGVAAAGLLLLYLGISIGDFSTRNRSMFHQIADLIQQKATTPTLIVMNSRAWGHILRLAYYLPPTAPVQLLAQHPADLAPALEKVLTSGQAAQYPRILWLDSARPVNKAPKTEAEKQQIQQEIQRVLKSRYQLAKTQQLSGTTILDEFAVNLYTSRNL
ncbi:glycosyltransferase family 39 protein [Coleofasciculus sp. FACHB-1120]|uniref:glycosyltransferase family 39 protein n=1 Tax=Coleofasciculus sp. FACHB-1120 TaxID=2692783 RepID=UPI0016878D33|nr:glycosyltransferase family 39 protein [Coleofasciculus sp. FACHB-1120]MBD2742833.1 glycosyltransferase family 39 protein [Coleofasciculus sp. FACHB-1120]